MAEKKNLFDYATKELSQDAFLRWFLESYDDPDISQYVVRFLEEVTGLDNLQDKLSGVKTHAQVAKIDVLCDFSVGEEKHLLVIEDKTWSKEHSNQLNRYTSKISKWKEWKNTSNKVHLLYYKTAYLSDGERKTVENADSCLGAKWKIWDLNVIVDFFSKIGNQTSSTIFDQYVDHVIKIKRELTSVSELPIREWSFRNWEGYFNQILLKKIEETFKDKRGNDYVDRTYFWGYQGRYVSINHYINPCKDLSDKVEFIPKLDLEIFLRPWQDEITATVHPAVSRKEGDKEEEWKCQDVYNKELREIARSSGGAFSALKTKQCVARFGKKKQAVKKKSQMKSVEELTKYLLELLISFHEVFEGKVKLDDSITKYEQVAIIKKEEEE